MVLHLDGSALVAWPVLLALPAAVLIVWPLYRIIYNLFFHPLSQFPGPKWAAATGWYAAYFDILVGQGGQYMYEIDRMHEEYGPIIRVKPDELHVRDAAFFEKLYAFGSKRDKSTQAADTFGAPTAIFSTAKHDVHKIRRAALNPFFTARSVVQMESVIHSKVERMCERMAQYMKHTKGFKLRHGFAATIIDIVTEYAYGNCENALDDPNFSPVWDEALQASVQMAPILRHWPGLINVIIKIPVVVLDRLNPAGAKISRAQMKIDRQILDIFARYSTKDGEFDPKKVADLNSNGQARSIFHEILTSSLPPHEKNPTHMSHEATSIQAAAVETSTNVLATTTFFILDNPAIHRRLKEELKKAIPDPTEIQKWKSLETLPYLTACLKEGLRISTPVTSRLPLICPDATLSYTPSSHVQGNSEWRKPYAIPPGQMVGMSYRDIALDPEIYPDPTTFDPLRWLPAESTEPEKFPSKYTAAQHASFERYLRPFGAGPRHCLGMNLAWADLYIIMASMMRRFDLELIDTVRSRDVDPVRDCFAAKQSKESTGIKVLFLKDHANDNSP